MRFGRRRRRSHNFHNNLPPADEGIVHYAKQLQGYLQFRPVAFYVVQIFHNPITIGQQG